MFKDRLTELCAAAREARQQLAVRLFKDSLSQLCAAKRVAAVGSLNTANGRRTHSGAM